MGSPCYRSFHDPSRSPPRGVIRFEAAARDDLRGLFVETVHRRGPRPSCTRAGLEVDQPVALKVISLGGRGRRRGGVPSGRGPRRGARSPHVVPWYSAGATDRFFCAPWSTSKGARWRRWLRSSQPMAPSVCLRLVGQVAAALDAAAPARRRPRGSDPCQRAVDAADDGSCDRLLVPWVWSSSVSSPGDSERRAGPAYRAPEQVRGGPGGPEGDSTPRGGDAGVSFGQALPREGNGMPPAFARALVAGTEPGTADRFANVAEFVGHWRRGRPRSTRRTAADHRTARRCGGVGRRAAAPGATSALGAHGPCSGCWC